MQAVEDGGTLSGPFGIDQALAFGLAFGCGLAVRHRDAPIPKGKAEFGMDFADALLQGGIGLEGQIDVADLGKDTTS